MGQPVAGGGAVTMALARRALAGAANRALRALAGAVIFVGGGPALLFAFIQRRLSPHIPHRLSGGLGGGAQAGDGLFTPDQRQQRAHIWPMVHRG